MDILSIQKSIEEESKRIQKIELPPLQEDFSTRAKGLKDNSIKMYHKVRIYIRTQLGKVKRAILK